MAELMMQLDPEVMYRNGGLTLKEIEMLTQDGWDDDEVDFDIGDLDDWWVD